MGTKDEGKRTKKGKQKVQQVRKMLPQQVRNKQMQPTTRIDQ